jgi:acyl-CoA synthetase (AMP-forming)/AMP-acid ligase II
VAQSTMMDYPLTVTQLLRHGARVHAEREVVTWLGESARRVSFADTYERIERLADALSSLGIGPGDVVGPSAGTTRSTSRRTSPCRAWVRRCTPSTSGCSPTSSTS